MSGATHFFEKKIDSLTALENRPFLFWSVLFLFLNYLYLKGLGADPDLFARVAVGRWITAYGQVAITDPFSFTETKLVWVDHEWLSGLVFYYLTHLGGDLSLYLAKLLFAVGSFFILLKAAFANHRQRIPIIIILLAVLDVSVVWGSTIRAQVFTYLAIPFFLLAIVNHRKNGSKFMLCTLPLATIIWANAHGGFVVGLGFLALYALVLCLERCKEAILVSCISFTSILATLINPYGFEYWYYLKDALSHSRPTITEWASVSFIDPSMAIYCLFLLITIFIIFKSPKKIPLEGYLILGSSIYFGFKHVRLTPIFTMASVVYVLPFLKETLKEYRMFNGELFKALSRSFTVVLILASLFWLTRIPNLLPSKFSLSYDFYPVDGVNWLYNNAPSGNVLVDFNRGSFALWMLYPKFKISVDGRYEEVYPEATVARASQAINFNDPSCKESLLYINPDYILIENGDRNLTSTDQTPCADGYSKIYSDPKFNIFGKNNLVDKILVDQSEQFAQRPIWQPYF